MELPQAGSDLKWIATVALPNVEGQAIAWDRSSSKPTLWAIKRSTSQALSFTVPYKSISDPTDSPFRSSAPANSRSSPEPLRSNDPATHNGAEAADRHPESQLPPLPRR